MATGSGTAAERRARAVALAAPPRWEDSYQSPWARVINAVGAIPRVFGRRIPRIDPEAMLASAQRRTGLDDWGDPQFLEGLRVLVRAFEERANSHTLGRIFFREYLTTHLVNRLKIQEDLKRHPEILDVPITRPLFVTGMPRSGTTLLQRLLSEDPNGRTLLTWECLEPSPPPRTETYRTDPRINKTRKTLEGLHRLAPRMASVHFFGAEEPEECNDLFANGFVAAIYGFMFDVPLYVEWLDLQELVDPYRYLRRQLQLLSWKCRGDHWILKAPAHQFALDALLTVFPDANIVVTHRNPLEFLPSICSLAASMRGISCERLDMSLLGSELNEALAVGPERTIATRQRSDPKRFFDVPYPRLKADPVGTAKSVCQHFGYECGDEYENRMRAWLANNPQHKHGVHRYSLEQFGLDAERVNRRFSVYLDWMAEHLPEMRK